MKKSILAGSLALVALSLVGCKGRTMDATPNGETVEVNIQPVESVAPADTLTPDVTVSGDTITVNEDQPVVISN